jgi:hypothetical protein
MTKTLFYRFFRIGGLSGQLKAQLESEGILLLDEGIWGSVTYIKFHRPGMSSGWEREWFSVSLVITQTRFAAIGSRSRPMINVPFADERFSGLVFSVEKAGLLQVAFDASLFHSDWSGTLEYRFHTSEAQAFMDMVKVRSAGSG